MLKKIYLSLVTVLALGVSAMAQTGGAIKITLTDAKTKESIPFANVIVTNNGVQAGVGTTDLDGVALVKPLPPGKYNVKAVYVGYQPKEVQGIIVAIDKTSYVSIALSNEEGVKLDEVSVVAYQEPLIDPDTKSGGTVTREEYQHMATKNVLSVASTTAGVYQADEGSSVNVRGSRSGGTQIFIDGERAIGTMGVPQQGVEQVSVVLGGLPAQYGDATGGVISITTRGPQSTFFGGVEAISSQLTDKFGYNFLGFSVGGPLLSKSDGNGGKKPVLGFFLAGEVVSEKDPDPSSVGVWKVKDSKLKEIEAKPLIKGSQGTNYFSGEFLTYDNLEKVKTRQNVASRSIRLSPKIDFKPTNNLNITLGGTWDYNNRHDFIYDYAMLNPANNPQAIEQTMRGYVRVTQKFGKETASEQEKSQSLVKNAYFSFQAGYQKYSYKSQDDSHKDKLFNYGYIGKFKLYKEPYYEYKNGIEYLNANGDTSKLASGWQLSGFRDTLLTFEAGSINPLATNYTQQVYDENQYYTATPGFKGYWNLQSQSDVALLRGLMNGDRPGNVHSLWLNTGRQFNGYTITDNRQFRIISSFSADIKSHAIMLGIEYDQRDMRNYSIVPTGLWTRMRQLVNQNRSSFDKSVSPSVIDPSFTAVNFFSGTAITDTMIAYNYQNINSLFVRNMLSATGHAENDRNVFLDVDNYDPTFYNMSWFSPDDLLNGGSGSLVDAYGFDYAGNRLKKSVSFDNFLTKTHNEKGLDVYDRLVGGFKPVYMAGYIQDKFDFKDIKFNVGVRVDRYDANQKVLKDKYLLTEAYTIKDLSGIAGNTINAPSNLSKDAVVYVDDFESASPVAVGYRNGDTWYDANGNEVQDSKLLADATTTGSIQPYLIDKSYNQTKGNAPYSNKAFKDYVPQINVMPRVAFAFPISDVANFFAHYDVLTQRPSSGLNRLDPKDYFFLLNNQGGTVANPNLKPEKTIDYELGFAQILSEKKNASLKITAYYREMRNLMQITRVNQAFPQYYLTYGNIDFGTVKGYSVEYDLRRSGGVAINANYTLQFAEGSGSNASGGYNLASTSQPNLRVLIPLDFDQRHTFTTTLDYRFGAGKDYTGPKISRSTGEPMQILKNVGFNMVFRAGSGTPYTRIRQANSDVLMGVLQNSTIAGNLNGSYLPWQFRADLRVDKNFELTWGKTEGTDRKTANLNIYLQVLNVFNRQNIISVHAYTGTPNDDGYLYAPTSQNALSAIQLQGGPGYYQSFTDLYTAKLNNPNYYSRPRVIRLGLQLDF